MISTAFCVTTSPIDLMATQGILFVSTSPVIGHLRDICLIIFTPTLSEGFRGQQARKCY